MREGSPSALEPHVGAVTTLDALALIDEPPPVRWPDLAWSVPMAESMRLVVGWPSAFVFEYRALTWLGARRVLHGTLTSGARSAHVRHKHRPTVFCDTRKLKSSSANEVFNSRTASSALVVKARSAVTPFLRCDRAHAGKRVRLARPQALVA